MRFTRQIYFLGSSVSLQFFITQFLAVLRPLLRNHPSPTVTKSVPLRRRPPRKTRLKQPRSAASPRPRNPEPVAPQFAELPNRGRAPGAGVTRYQTSRRVPLR